MATSITLNDIIYRMYEQLRAFPNISDSIDVREFANWTMTYRAKVLRQKIDKYSINQMDESYVQDLGAVGLEIVDSSTHDVLETNHNIVRTKIDLPLPIETSKGLGLYTRISPADRLEQRFKLINFDSLPFVGSGRFNSHEVFASQYGKRIYIYSKDPSFFEMKFINVRGVFSNPLEAMLFINPIQTIDQLYANEYPVNASMVEDIIMTAVTTLYKFNVSGFEDKINNQSDDLVNKNMQ
jgi:hypothetical protein